jgi:hypothetical protein
MERAIIHINVADFAVAVERVLDRRLAERPVIIAPQGAARAAVYDMSEEAFQAGVRKQMPLGRALRRCRDARLLPPRPHRYGQAMNRTLQSALPCPPPVEPGRESRVYRTTDIDDVGIHGDQVVLLDPEPSSGPPGTYWFRGSWNRPDRLLLAPGLIDDDGLRFVGLAVEGDAIMGDSSGQPYSWRTSTEDGYSDHYPIVATFRID